MDPVSATVVVDKSPEEVFAYLVDVANHAEFTDHYLSEWRLTREDSYGRGAGARFRIDAPLNRFSWADATLIEVERPHRIVTAGRGGKFNRVRHVTSFELSPGAGGMTRIEMTTDTEPVTISDRLMEAFAGRGWLRRKGKKAMRRLRSILEEGQDRGRRATVAGG